MSKQNKPKASKYGLLREDIQMNDARRREKIRRWIRDFSDTDYPNRPLTDQYSEIMDKAKELNLI